LDPGELHVLEGKGFDFGHLAAGAEARSTRALAALPALRGLFATLQSDVLGAARPFPLARVTSVDGFRLFDARWLASDEMTFSLIGVFNRLDRRSFYEGTCGEVRFVYRLSYTTQQGGKPMTSRLPMTLNVVYFVSSDGDPRCEITARSWQAPANVGPAEAASWLVSTGSLGDAQRRRWQLKSVESNLQTFRLQSSVHPTLAGHIEYGLRVFHPAASGRAGFVAAPMENMPDVPALKRDAVRREELLALLKEPAVLASIDRGTLTLPDRFLAKQATSFSPRGLSRLHNRPFRELFDATDFAGLNLGSFQTIASPAALLRRLDGASCVGCHQSRSIAGFHHVGQDAADTPAYSALFSGSSLHLHADLERRRTYVAAVARGAPADEFRPIPERQGVGSGEGAPCGLSDPGFASWTCDAGFRCEKLEDPEVGTCLAKDAVGAPCEYGTLSSGARPDRDRVDAMTKHACAATQTCETNFQGFPQGACDAGCTRDMPGGRCADFLDVDGFQECLRSRSAVDVCAKRAVLAVGLASCDADHACRQDYVCARTRTPDRGACMPPYFVFQLRLDGYPLPH
jgi:hypothetical protein